MASGDSGGQRHGQDKGSLSRYKGLRPLPLGEASGAMWKFNGRCGTLGRDQVSESESATHDSVPRLGDAQAVTKQRMSREGGRSSK